MSGDHSELDAPLVRLGMMDRILRFQIGLIILVTAYVSDLTILPFAFMHIVTVYIWLTMLIAWDPFYYVVKFIRRKYIEIAVMYGRI